MEPNPIIPRTITEQLQAIEPGAYSFIEGAKAQTVQSILSRIKVGNSAIYRTQAADGGVRVWRFAEEKRIG